MKKLEAGYSVNELFVTIQGEGTFTGVASVFVRLQGCDVGCPWCDTKHTWKVDPQQRAPLDVIVAKDSTASPTYAVLLTDELVYEIKTLAKGTIRHVVITGGEPCMHDLIPLIAALRKEQFYVQVETSGTYKPPMRQDYWLTLSPKLDMPGGKEVLATAWLRADEIKLPVGKQADVDRFTTATQLWFDTFKDKRIYLQPLSQSPTATKLCIDQAIERGWCVSIQTHKYVGIR